MTSVEPLGAPGQAAYVAPGPQTHAVQPQHAVPAPVGAPPPQQQPLPYSSGYGQPVYQQQASGPYGQNTAAAQQDQQRWNQQQAYARQQQQQQQQQQQVYAAQPVQTSTDPFFVSVTTAPMTPPGLICTASDDFMFVHSYHNAWLSVICVAGLIWAGLLISLIVGNRSVGVIVVFVICCIALPVCAWFTTQQRVVFCKSRREVQLMQKRLLLHFCGDQIINVIAFNEIVNVGFSGGTNVAGELYIEGVTTTIVLGHRQYYSTMDLQSEVVAWQVYAASLTGTTLESFMARTVRQVATGIANAVRR